MAGVVLEKNSVVTPGHIRVIRYDPLLGPVYGYVNDDPNWRRPRETGKKPKVTLKPPDTYSTGD